MDLGYVFKMYLGWKLLTCFTEYKIQMFAGVILLIQEVDGILFILFDITVSNRPNTFNTSTLLVVTLATSKALFRTS